MLQVAAGAKEQLLEPSPRIAAVRPTSCAAEPNAAAAAAAEVAAAAGPDQLGPAVLHSKPPGCQLGASASVPSSRPQASGVPALASSALAQQAAADGQAAGIEAEAEPWCSGGGAATPPPTNHRLSVKQAQQSEQQQPEELGEQEQPAGEASSGGAAPNVAEARAWIANWKAKQQQN